MASVVSSGARFSPSVREYTRGADALADSRYRISSGERIVRTGDDSTSVSLASRLQGQTTNLRGSLQGGARATSFLQVAYDGLQQVKTILESLSDLTAEANSTGQTKLSYATLDAQFQSQKATIDTVVAATKFNGASILDGSASGGGSFVAYVGESSGGTMSLPIPSVTSASLLLTPTNLSNAANSTTATTTVSNAQQTVADAIAKVDAYLVRLETASQAVTQNIQGINEGFNALTKADVPAETASANVRSLHQDIAATVLAQASLRFNGDLLNLVR